ncbi:GNAT family N-acetyltransferase [Halorubrum ezzemoulense]|uniref:GNAT family N-acetyltransferase n=1 Tax=Halorubrum ezzemoulense TaxID=337243 RepID=UPI00232BA37B|nr:GNAT family N-acetyltransferase [Halorubrum ezzemoulense]MDB2273617.1 GNAT family N-acetyltransferase [Halorubrum ezzemoulense]
MSGDRPAIRRLPSDEEALRRYAADLWLPYNRDLADAVGVHDLADWPEERFVERHVEFARNQLDDSGSRGWVAATAADGADDAAVDPATAAVTDPDLDLVGLLMTSVDACPDPFDRPDRLVIGEIYVAAPYRGTGLADRFVERAVADARDHGCGQLRLDVDVDNERAVAFYERTGFEEYRKQVTMAVDPE